MNRSIVRQLILKDWQLYRPGILLTTGAGAIALAITQRGSEPTVVVGAVFFFIALNLVGTMLPLIGIVNERKKQNLAFLMSLPVSFLEYTAAKMISTLVMFLGPWLTLVIAAVLLVERRGMGGAIPILLILSFLPFVGMSLVTAAALIGETEGWGIAANVFTSSTYGLTWYFLSRMPGVMAHSQDRTPVWNAAKLNVLGIEFGLVVLILTLTFYLQSRKRDFI